MKAVTSFEQQSEDVSESLGNDGISTETLKTW
jgi:hypothetical protein